MALTQLAPLFGLPVGPEVLVIVLIAILLFGANKIPELARSTGEAMGEFQKGREEAEQELEEMRSELEDNVTPDSGMTDTESMTDTEMTDTGTSPDGGTATETEPQTETETTE
jgi:sec-independent protein translocase protein TatA